jgi:hypothetical protein
MLLALFIISLIRGKGDGSMTGVIKCSGIDWFLFALLLAISVLLTIVAIFLLRKEET